MPANARQSCESTQAQRAVQEGHAWNPERDVPGRYTRSCLIQLASDPLRHDFEANASDGYYFSGGGYVGNRMTLSRYDFGIGGGQSELIDITSGLAPLPQKGSFSAINVNGVPQSEQNERSRPAQRSSRGCPAVN